MGSVRIETESNVLTAAFTTCVLMATVCACFLIGGYEIGKKAGLIENLEDVKVNEFLFAYCGNGVRIEYQGDEYHIACLKIKQEK